MSLNTFRDRVYSLISYISFEYNNTDCGIDPLAKDHFDMWYGDEYYKAESIDDVMSHPLFDGKSLTEIFDNISNLEY